MLKGKIAVVGRQRFWPSDEEGIAELTECPAIAGHLPLKVPALRASCAPVRATLMRIPAVLSG